MSKVINIREYNRNEISAAKKFETLKILNLNILTHLSSAEAKVLMFIWHRTVYWGKTSEYIPRRHFMDGVGEVAAPVGVSLRGLINALASLEKSGVLKRWKAGNGGSYYSINFAWELPMLREPKNPKGRATGTLKEPKNRGCKNCTGTGAKTAPHKYENNKYELLKEGSAPSGARPDDLQDSINRATAKSRERKAAKLAKASQYETAGGLERLWAAEVATRFPDADYTAWTVKDFGMVSKFRKNFSATQGSKTWPFFQFIIEHWQRIGVLYFSWMKNDLFPAYPDVGLVLKFKKQFLHAFTDEKFLVRQMNLSRHEREINKLKKLGYTQAQAEEACAKDLEHGKVAEKQTRRAEVAEIDVRALATENAQLKKENTRLRVRDGERLMKQDRERDRKMNPGSKPKRKYDKDGFAIFDGEDL
jgi:hypothetical protein